MVPQSLCQSQKNTIDPELMIQQYGADPVRWFILSDSPPEKDIQWSDSGVSSANKFLQRLWSLNFKILNRKEPKFNNSVNEKFSKEINNYVNKIDENIKNFRLNVAIANFYQLYKIFNENLDKEIDNKTMFDQIKKMMKILIPFTPHLAHECLEQLKCKEYDKWPEM